MSHTINWFDSEDAREVEAWLVYNETNTRVRLGAINRELADNPEIKKAFQSAMSVCAVYAMRKIRTGQPTAARPIFNFGNGRSRF